MADTTTMPEWSATLLNLGRRSGNIPIYGSDEWHQLEPHDPCRFAAVVRAAEAWRRESEPDVLAARLEDELAENDQLAVMRTRAALNEFEEAFREFRKVGHRDEWGTVPRTHMVSWRELERRRAEPGWVHGRDASGIGELAKPYPPPATPWTREELTCPIDLVRPPTRWFSGIPAATPCGPDCCRRLRRQEVA